MSNKQANKKGLKNNGIKVGDWVVFRAKKGNTRELSVKLVVKPQF
ncbi:MAG: hypothetical protein ACFFDI_07065 [Promethearchaeota archaeon]